ncbi:hypothetical protein JCGZ_18636 [Jatropha curcas]|uniref:Glycosyltransferase N-terminal domain-containing protein n=1 Tax=Jatropha curcas TaxID=180498 RepID=A0A067K0H4_JATCU|nr:hypothetical protein JCGZ_18636 [Jatropha curcas]
MGSLSKPHAVLIPFPAQGHINPFMQLAKLLHSRGYHITFVNNEFNQKRLLRSKGPELMQGLPADFRFEAIPDGLPPSNPDATQDIPSLCDSARNYMLGPFRELLAKINSLSSDQVPKVTCIISDAIMSFALLAAEELGVPGVPFWTNSACGFLAYLHLGELVKRGLVPYKSIYFLVYLLSYMCV